MMSHQRLCAMVVLVTFAQAIPTEDNMQAVGSLLNLVQEQKAPPQVAEYDVEQFATLMNRIVQQAGKMRIVMNKLGISDTDSVRKVEEHFIRLGESHHDLGEGTATEEQLRLHGLQARLCVKHAVTCSHMAAGCHATPKHCKQVVEHCSQAAAACGVGESMKTKKKEKEKAKSDSEMKIQKDETKGKKKPATVTSSAHHEEKSGQPHKKAADTISLIEEEESDNDDDLALDDASESLDEQLSNAQAEAEELAGDL